MPSLVTVLAIAFVAIFVDRYAFRSAPATPADASTAQSRTTHGSAEQSTRDGTASVAARADEYTWETIAEAEASELGPLGTMRMEWQTPIYHVNIKSFLSPEQLNTRLAKMILRQFRQLEKANKDKLSANGWSPNGINQIFFEWQRDGGWARHFADQPDMAQLGSFVRFAARTVLEAVGYSGSLQLDAVKMQGWATVHYDCISHLAHTHPNNVLSAVYYVQVPTDAGPLIFFDPRGPLPPFDGTITIHPKAGDLVVFPSWLRHEVGPTRGSEERISIAFNLPGEWEDTASVRAHMPLESLQ
eukprot:m.244697 g.244697  ORF g.244697 m.244697 type:complete len:301 (-) comp14500_c0_seq1:100-1002(-)